MRTHAIESLPEGFHKVSVVLTGAELQTLKREAILTASGTYSAAIRLRLHMTEHPYGLKAALHRQKEN